MTTANTWSWPTQPLRHVVIVADQLVLGLASRRTIQTLGFAVGLGLCRSLLTVVGQRMLGPGLLVVSWRCSMPATDMVERDVNPPRASASS